MNRNKAAQEYAKLNRSTALEDANPHQLIQMLFQGALDSMQQAIGSIERSEFEQKGRHIGRAISIIGGLQGVLDHEKGGEISANLDRLYDYMAIRLYEATAENSVAKVREVIDLMKEIKTGWDGIAQEASRIFAEGKQQVAG